MCWASAEPDPHYAHREFRLNKGDVDFVEMPLSVDMSEMLTSKKGVKHYADLRTDTDWEAEYGTDYTVIAKNILDGITVRNPQVPVINFVAHNDERYWDATDSRARFLEESLSAAIKACSDKGIQLYGATLADINDQVRRFKPEVAKATLAHGMY